MTTAAPMRRLSVIRAHALNPRSHAGKASLLLPLIAALKQPTRTLANIREPDVFSDVWFSANLPRRTTSDSAGPPGTDGKPPDERTVKLGKTIRIIHERLPSLLASPLPQDILSPQIQLHLFPSTHPHLPSVSGKIAYTAALWTAPVAWGRIPFVGNIKLRILSERMVRNGGSSTAAHLRNERLIVRWRTCGKTKGKGTGANYEGIREGEQVDRITEWLGGDAPDDKEFCGLFLFEFDEQGRIASHTIEHAEERGNWDKMPKVISVTDWLLGKAWRRRTEEVHGLALGYCELEKDRRLHLRRGRKE